MKILVVAPTLPKPDQKSGDLRLSKILECLVAHHQVEYLPINTALTVDPRHEAALTQSGIVIRAGPLSKLLRDGRFDIVLFEFFFTAEKLIEDVRVWQPGCRVVVDSVDVHFFRLRLKAEVTQNPDDATEAEDVRRREVAVYSTADAVIAVSDEDRHVLHTEGIKTPVLVVPNIHEMHPIQPRPARDRVNLIFIGNFLYPPNLDAIQYFHRSILPVLLPRVPRLLLRLVGAGVKREVEELSSDNIEIVGYVPRTTPYLYASDISIAPLRYGAGAKGKVGEAMAHGLPVVTTSIGAQGFECESGRELMIADDPEAFAEAIANLASDRVYHEKVRRAGWAFVDEHFSPRVVSDLLVDAIAEIGKLKPRGLNATQRLAKRLPYFIDKHVAWRLRGARPLTK